MVDVAREASDLALDIRRKFERHPIVAELDIDWPDSLQDPVEQIEYLALMHTTLHRAHVISAGVPILAAYNPSPLLQPRIEPMERAS